LGNITIGLDISTNVAIIVSGMNLLAIKIKETRALREWTQNDLAQRSGVNRGYLACIETGKVANPSVDIFLKLARAFNVRPEELYQAAGYIKEAKPSFQFQETSEQILERLRLAHPATIPVYTAYPFAHEPSNQPIAFLYRDKKEANRSLEGYLIYGGKPLMEPEIKDEDIIIVDRDGEINNGNIIACIVDDALQLGRLKKIGGDLWLENNEGRIKFVDCEVPGVVIELIRGLK